MTHTKPAAIPTLMHGVPSDNKAVFHRLRFDAHDPVSLIEFADGRRVTIVRDVERAQVRRLAHAGEVFVYEDFAPEVQPLSGDRTVRAAQAVAECLRRAGVGAVRGDRTVPLVVVDELRRAGIGIELDPGLGVTQRRAKTPIEVEALRAATRKTERAIEEACRMIAQAEARTDGVLVADGAVVTSERVRALVDRVLGEQGCLSVGGCIVAGGAAGADCHFAGAGELRTGEAVIVDVFPLDRTSHYHGDCTRCVVHGDVPDEIVRMHATVAEAKAAGIAACRSGTTGEDVHKAVVGVLERDGYATGFPPDGAEAGFCSMPHGTGHGLGLELKEPPLLDFGGPALVVGDAVTVEPGLYAVGLGGIRLEDLVIVGEDGCENLNELPEGLDWR